MKLAWITDSVIFKGFRELTTRITDGLVDSSKASFPFGFESNPTKNYMAIVAKTQKKGEDVVIGYLNPRALESLNLGDSMIYSTDISGNINAKLTMRNDGTVEILSNADNAVRYSKLKEEYDKTKDVLDAILSTLDTPIAEPGNGAPSAFQAAIIAAVGTLVTGDIASSKIEEIKVP